MPLLVERTFIMDWHELEKIPYGIGECRHGGREAGTQQGQGSLAWLQGAWLPSQPHTQAARPPALCLCACARAFLRLDPGSILVEGPVGTFICVYLSICLSVCVQVEMNGELGAVPVLCHQL